MRITDANEDWYVHTPLFDDVDVVGGSIALPFLTNAAHEHDPG